MKKKTFVILLSLMLAVSFSVALAEENKGESQSTREQKKAELEQKKAQWKAEREEWKTERQQELEKAKARKEEFKAMREKFTAERCARIQERVNNRIENFGSGKEKHMSAYNNLLNRIDKFIARFEAFNTTSPTKLDLTEIKADRAQLTVLIANFKTSYTEYVAKISATKNLTCGHSEGEFRSALVDARTYLKTVHDNAAAIRTFVRETVLPDLLELKKQVAEIKGEAADENESASESNNENKKKKNSSGTETANETENDGGTAGSATNTTTTNATDTTGTNNTAL